MYITIAPPPHTAAGENALPSPIIDHLFPIGNGKTQTVAQNVHPNQQNVDCLFCLFLLHL